ncbi:hypothetical protein [Streptomyces brasiliscabiei]|uniref:Uncharacterized protein n=1 Tax=Streptomyces brasiliscabiei TaxID=2736302 RepID=A0ABU8GQR6_9ACTN
MPRPARSPSALRVPQAAGSTVSLDAEADADADEAGKQAAAAHDLEEAT